MSENFIGLSQGNALGTGGTELDGASAQLRHDLHGLIGELESDHRAMQGGSLLAFAKAKHELFTRFEELVSFCRANGMNLTAAQTQVAATDEAGVDHFAAAHAEIGGISSRMSG